nr:eukaryotic peptide chain release factor subunit 1 [Quercus suber]
MGGVATGEKYLTEISLMCKLGIHRLDGAASAAATVMGSLSQDNPHDARGGGAYLTYDHVRLIGGMALIELQTVGDGGHWPFLPLSAGFESSGHTLMRPATAWTTTEQNRNVLGRVIEGTAGRSRPPGAATIIHVIVSTWPALAHRVGDAGRGVRHRRTSDCRSTTSEHGMDSCRAQPQPRAATEGFVRSTARVRGAIFNPTSPTADLTSSTLPPSSTSEGKPVQGQRSVSPNTLPTPGKSVAPDSCRCPRRHPATSEHTSSYRPSIMSAPQANDAEKNIEIWKVKKLIKRLEAARGNGTSMISLIIPPKDQVSRAAKMLAEEFGTASNIKSRVNRLSVLSAITSTQQRLKLYSKVPPNGLVVYCGEIITSEGKERKINIDFEPFKPINTSLYLCDNKFHTEALSELLESDQKFGFIIMDGNGALFGTLSGNTREVVQKFSVDLPKKHGRGGQSALRFARLREEKRHNYVRKVAELAVQNFITADKVNVAGLILAGSADFKNDLNQSDLFDGRLSAKVVKVVDVSYGGENGFNQAIELSSETLSNVKFIQEKKLINKYFDEISQDTGKVCYGIDDTLKALEAGAAETLIVYENLEMTRWELKNSEGGQLILNTTKAQEADRSIFMDKDTGQEMDVVDQMPFLEWLAEKYRDFGATLEFVSDRSSEGNQFVKGFGESEASTADLPVPSTGDLTVMPRPQQVQAATATATASGAERLDNATHDQKTVPCSASDMLVKRAMATTASTRALSNRPKVSSPLKQSVAVSTTPPPLPPRQWKPLETTFASALMIGGAGD